MNLVAQSSDVPIRNNDVLDEFEIPVGSWVDQMVDWIDIQFGSSDGSWIPLLDWIKWPFDFLLTNVVDEWLLGLSWTTFCIGIFFVGYFVRNAKVGFVSAFALAGCGLLGENYWLETARTVGFIGVAVALCIVIGIPLGVACGRVDSIWAVVRPVLDAMQVVHPFVYMLPFIFFFGIGEESATMATMVFALPPLIRLTNLGIRQVPADVIEASRAYGAPEPRVLRDVQLPLARPAIMTGINQTLLLAISMLGIAAIMGAGGLGRLLFQALSNLDVAQAASGGLAFFLVAVVMDRLSQPEANDGSNLLTRIGQAWATRSDPSALIPNDEDRPDVAQVLERLAPINRAESRAMVLLAGSAAVAAVSVMLPWGSGAGLVSAHARRSDELLPGLSFNGLEASGGTWFGVAFLGSALFCVYAVAVAFSANASERNSVERRRVTGIVIDRSTPVIVAVGFVIGLALLGGVVGGVAIGIGFGLVRPAATSRWLGADGAVIASTCGAVLANTYLVMGEAAGTSGYSHGSGAFVGAIVMIVALVASFRWLSVAPAGPLKPLTARVETGRIVGASAALLVVVIAGFSGWTFDSRADSVVTPEVQAEIDRLTEFGRTDPENAATYAAEISATMARVQRTGTVIHSGFSSDGAGLGTISLALAVAGLAAGLPAAGLFGASESQRYHWSAVTMAIGLAIMFIASSWVVSIARVAGPENIVSGAGAFLALAGGFLLMGSARNTVAEFSRTKVYGDEVYGDAVDAGGASGETVAAGRSTAIPAIEV